MPIIQPGIGMKSSISMVPIVIPSLLYMKIPGISISPILIPGIFIYRYGCLSRKGICMSHQPCIFSISMNGQGGIGIVVGGPLRCQRQRYNQIQLRFSLAEKRGYTGEASCVQGRQIDTQGYGKTLKIKFFLFGGN